MVAVAWTKVHSHVCEPSSLQPEITSLPVVRSSLSLPDRVRSVPGVSRIDVTMAIKSAGRML